MDNLREQISSAVDKAIKSLPKADVLKWINVDFVDWMPPNALMLTDGTTENTRLLVNIGAIKPRDS